MLCYQSELGITAGTITPRWKATVFASVPQSARYVGPSWSEGVFLIDDDDDDDDYRNVSLNHGEKVGFCG